MARVTTEGLVDCTWHTDGRTNAIFKHLSDSGNCMNQLL